MVGLVGFRADRVLSHCGVVIGFEGSACLEGLYRGLTSNHLSYYERKKELVEFSSPDPLEGL